MPLDRDPASKDAASPDPLADLAGIRKLVDSGLFDAALSALASVEGASVTVQDRVERLALRMTALNGLGRWQETISAGDSVLGDLAPIRDPRLMARVHALIGYANLRQGNPRNAESHLRAAIHIATWDLADPAEIVQYQRILAFMFHGLGRWGHSQHELLKAIEIADERGFDRESGGLRINLALTQLKCGELAAVAATLDAADLSLVRSEQTKRLLLSHLVRANYLRITGHPGKALEILGPALATCREQKYSREEAITLEYMGDCHLAHREYRRALELYEAGMTIAEATAPRGDLIPELCHRIAEVQVHLGDPNKAIVLCERGLRVARDISDRYEECATHRPLAMAHRAAGNPRKALRSVDEGIELARTYEIPYELARSLAWAGDVRLGDGGAEEQAYGRRQLWEARGVFARLGLTSWIHTIDRSLGFAEESPAVEEPGLAALETIETIDRNALRFGIVTCDPNMREAIATVQSVAPSPIPVLISGESGVGKELLAQALHQMSERRRNAFVALNCGAVPVNLVESELFGHERGAFTGALQNREGLITSADGGTLFLDEIGELPAPVQASLLRVLESGELRAVGQDVVRKVNIRIVAATNANVEDLVERGVFRQDLYYRLNGVRVTLPPLRDREADIRAMFRYFWAQAVATARKTLRLSGEVEATLCAYSWPGNVRELKHEIARVVALATDGSIVTPDAFLQHLMRKQVAVLRRARVRRDELQDEREEILEALRAHRGNKAEAARSLGGMKRTTLLYKIERLGIRPEEYEARE